MKKVLIIHNRLVIGGPAIAIAETIRQLNSQFQFYLIVGQPLKGEQEARYLFADIPNLTIISIPSMHRMPGLWSDWKAYRILIRTIRGIRPDVVHTHGTKPGILGRLAASRLKVPVIIHTYHGHIFHSYFNKIISKSIVWIERFLAKKTNYIIAISNFLRHEIITIYKIAGAGKVIMIPLGLNLSAFENNKSLKRDQFRSKFKVQEDEMVVAVVGRITAIKNLPMFIEVLSVLQKANHPARLKFFIIGDGEEKQKLFRQLQFLKIPYETESNLKGIAKVVFTSWIMEMDLVMNGIDILCLTSLNEGTPVSILEAMAAGKPVITTNAGSVAEIVQNGGTGIVTPVHAVARFAQAVQQLALNPALSEKMGAQGKQTVFELCDPVRASEQLQTLYDSAGN